MQGEDGLYILTGSTSVNEKKIKHSGAGRISRLCMNTMSLYESRHSNGSVSLHINTLDDYLEAFRRLYVITEVPAWSPQLRSKTTIRISNTRHFVDPAIAAHFLKANSEDLLFDLKTFGLLFESLVVRDLTTYSQGLDGVISHHRDKDGLEADAILHLSVQSDSITSSIFPSK